MFPGPLVEDSYAVGLGWALHFKSFIDDPDSYLKVKSDGFKMAERGGYTHGRAGMSTTDNHPRTLLCVPALEWVLIGTWKNVISKQTNT